MAVPFCAGQTSNLSPRIGWIEVFGAQKASRAKIQSAIGAKAGDVLPPSEATEERINKISGVLVSRLQAFCCTGDGNVILYVGIEERGAAHIEFHPAPAREIKLPDTLYDKYLVLLETIGDSIRAKTADEDLTNGYSLMADPYAREIQRGFVDLVEKNFAAVDQVLHESADPEERAAAAYLLQYGPRGPRTSKIIADGLQYALRDRDDVVRKSAFRALRAVMVGAKLHPEQGIAIEPTWFVELLNSMVWSDRRNASLALVDLTQDRKPETLALLRERAQSAVIEMARWRDLEHALPAFLLAGRMAGVDEAEIKDAWVKEDRESILSELEAGRKHKRR